MFRYRQFDWLLQAATDGLNDPGKALAAGKSIEDIRLLDVVSAGMSLEDAQQFAEQLWDVIISVGISDLARTWERISRDVLKPYHPHGLHSLMYHATYRKWNLAENGPPPVWNPTRKSARETNLGKVMEAFGTNVLGEAYENPIRSFSSFQKWSAVHPEMYLEIVLERVSVLFHQHPTCMLETSAKNIEGGEWLPGAILNAAESALACKPEIGKLDESVAIVWRDEGNDHLPVNSLNYAEVRTYANKVANALVATGFQRGDAIGIMMPMTVEAVVAYLGIVLAGMAVVSIADSFVGTEVATRCRLSRAKGIITQDIIPRGAKRLPLYSRVVEAMAPKAIVIPADRNSVSVSLRAGDVTWKDFITYAEHAKRPEDFTAVALPGYTISNVLFSSGTTGNPKAIPWTHLSPIKCGIDAWGHHDVRPGDIFSWPTNLGWMMGPFLIYAAFLNGAAIALYNGSPLGRGYGTFVQDGKISIHGTVPSLVKAWRNTNCMANLDWTRIRAFSSTGEASSLDDDLWLASRASYGAPIIEYCGGTELAGGYVGGSLLQSQALAAFSTPCMTHEFVILDDNGNIFPEDGLCTGEVGLVATNFGASSHLLNADHGKVYYNGMPLYKEKRLRRHGDLLERMAGGFYRAHGRSDDTMNLGGIKASAVEIERVCDVAHTRVRETAAIAVPPSGGGPEQLVVLAIVSDGPPVSTELLQKALSSAIQTKLNPLFKVASVQIVSEFPRTASNKLLRRVLRANFLQKPPTASKM